MYLALTLLINRALRKAHGVQNKKALALAMLIASLYAVSDEIHQRYVPGRHGRARDVAMDAIGVGVAWPLVIFSQRRQSS